MREEPESYKSERSDEYFVKTRRKRHMFHNKRHARRYPVVFSLTNACDHHASTGGAVAATGQFLPLACAALFIAAMRHPAGAWCCAERAMQCTRGGLAEQLDSTGQSPSKKGSRQQCCARASRLSKRRAASEQVRVCLRHKIGDKRLHPKPELFTSRFTQAFFYTEICSV